MKRLSWWMVTVIVPAAALGLVRTRAGKPAGSVASPPTAIAPATARVTANPWDRLDRIVDEEVRGGAAPGAVLLVQSRGETVYRKAFGYRSVGSERVPMTADTLFDLASLTKAVATTSAMMALVQDGKVDLNAPVAHYWPAFGANGKGHVTLRQLMTHSSGLPAWLPLEGRFRIPGGGVVQDRTQSVLDTIAALPLRQPPDTAQVYSDLGFVALGEVVRRVSREPLDRFAERRIFQPLGMADTHFCPDARLRERAAPTMPRDGRMLQGYVHDPTAALCGGVAGNAGLFSTADDLALFAGMLLSSDTPTAGTFPLRPETIRRMTSRTTPDLLPARGLGWDIDSAFSKVRGDWMPLGSFGHTGFTGTFLWVDPYSQTAIIGLTSRLHPNGKGNARLLWARVCNVASEIVWPDHALTGLRPRPPLRPGVPEVLTGLDVLRRDGFKLLAGSKVGLITNRSGITRDRLTGVDLLSRAPGVHLRSLFTPEHGLRTDIDRSVDSTHDKRTGLPVYSLYRPGAYQPTPQQLKGLDTLVFDIQDVGLRYYTYVTTLGLCMQAARQAGIRFVVLDRPNPNNGNTLDGPLLDPAERSFTGFYRLPVRYGMTIGELAQFYNTEFGIGCNLKVVPLEGWRRDMALEDTGLPWVDPSPNIRKPEEAVLYSSLGLLEGANLSVGRGTATPFELVGAPWIDGRSLAARLEACNLPGISFAPTTFRPGSSVYAGTVCGGVAVRLTDRTKLQSCRAAVTILGALASLYPQQCQLEGTARLFGTKQVPAAIRRGNGTDEIVAVWDPDLRAFDEKRRKYILYPTVPKGDAAVATVRDP